MMHARFFSTLSLFLPALVWGQVDTSAQRFVLDYDVPESPALIALGAAPGSITRGSASKPVVASLLNEVRTGQKLTSGVALDFAPYFLYGGRLKSVDEYRRDWRKRWLANLQLSIATIQSETDTGSLRVGFGARIVFFDSHDLLQDATLGADLDQALSRAANALRPVRAGDEVGAPVAVAGLTDAYRRARERVRTKPGDALSAGWGVSAVLRGAVASGDSIGTTRHRLWVSYRHTFSGGMDLLATAQWRQADTSGTSVRAGAGLRANGRDANLALELYFDSDPHLVSTGRIGIGANAEWRFTHGVGLVAALATEPTTVAAQTVQKLRVRTALRWDMNGEQ
jgi:hypothetical protein